jgi:alkanesulfonate monooxygenase SsuD/methylene tetrahydromethanopterin reductase-like flavin-dependent oxidoreductase (luciferase family)
VTDASDTGGGLAIGLTPWLDDWDGSAHTLAAQGEFAERLGFHSFWLPESHFNGRASNPAPLLRLAAVAARTRTLAIGTTSFLLPVRHPIHVAEEVAVLDRLSNGRVILGVGRGFRSALFTAFDVPRREKRDRFEAALDTILKAWRGDPIAPSVNDPTEERGPVHLAPLPVQKPHPPVWVAGFGPKALDQAGRLGLPYLASPIETFDRLVENYARHREALPEKRRERPMAVPIMRTVFVSRRPERLARAQQALARQAAALARAPAPNLRLAAHAEVDDWAIVGEPAAVADGIARYRDALGMTHLIARVQIPGLDADDIVDSLEALAGLGVQEAGHGA